jgi:hypothetical protein
VLLARPPEAVVHGAISIGLDADAITAPVLRSSRRDKGRHAQDACMVVRAQELEGMLHITVQGSDSSQQLLLWE